uniref:7TM_GPCR_Srx domain-containing protein n=1 Tax=Heterorhabditis bacteriophora TaxID=37862 RepID=A0A1I7W8K9_HETBA
MPRLLGVLRQNASAQESAEKLKGKLTSNLRSSKCAKHTSKYTETYRWIGRLRSCAPRVVLISQDANMNAAWDGVILSVCSATSSAFYKLCQWVLFKRLLGNADLAQVSLFMTCIGFVNLLLNWVPGIILMLTGKEYIKWMFIPWLPIIGATNALITII